MEIFIRKGALFDERDGRIVLISYMAVQIETVPLIAPPWLRSVLSAFTQGVKGR
jgi:hypothetical protein